MPATSESRPWVAYIVPFPYPWGQAGSRRVHGVSRSIAATGRDVVIIATPGPQPPDSVVARPPLRNTVATGAVRAITRRSLPGSKLTRQWTHHVSGASDALELIEQESSRTTLPSHVIVYGTLATSLSQVLRWGRTHRVAVIADVVERYSPRQFRYGPISPSFISSIVGFETVAPFVDGVIAISRHLDAHFAARGVPTVRVPPTADLHEVAFGSPTDDNQMVFGYFGSPGGKDLLEVVLDAFLRVRRTSGREGLRLRIGGPGTRETVLAGNQKNLQGVELLGQVPQREVSAVLGSLHATMLARPAARYSAAGYPTKVVESLCAGTPVVCNLTSDLEEVIREGETGWVAQRPNAKELTSAISRAAETSPADLRRMRNYARRTAEQWFDSARYVEPLDALLVATS